MLRILKNVEVMNYIAWLCCMTLTHTLLRFDELISWSHGRSCLMLCIGMIISMGKFRIGIIVNNRPFLFLASKFVHHSAWRWAQTGCKEDWVDVQYVLYDLSLFCCGILPWPSILLVFSTLHFPHQIIHEQYTTVVRFLFFFFFIFFNFVCWPL